VVQDEAHGLDGAIEALDVEVFGLLVWPADGEELEGTYLGEDEDEAGVEVAGEAGILAVELPLVICRGLGKVRG
jgi:hypothetical protein